MKKSVKVLFQRIRFVKFMFLAAAILTINGVYAQENHSISGKLIDIKNNQPVQFATIALVRSSDSTITGGTMSDENGVFTISPVHPGKYLLRVSNIGYKQVTKSIEVINTGVTDAGTLPLEDTSILLRELVITGERMKAKSESDRTTFLVTKKMLDVSSTGADLLRLVPGVQIDLMQNITLEGSSDILIYVDGKERDKNFVAQLNPARIDKIEVISSPPSNYDGNLTGAINIILKKERDSGITGQIITEIPTSSSFVYIFPTYNLNYSLKKLNLYTSFNGEMAYLNLHEDTYRKAWNESVTNEITSSQVVRQKDWSGRFHYGFDYYLTGHDQLSFYGFYNPYSRELDGTAYTNISGAADKNFQARKEDTDVNTGTYYSLYYKHSFDNKGREFTAEVSNYYLTAVNKTEYLYEDTLNGQASQTNTMTPKQNVMSVKLDYTTPLRDNLTFSTGLKTRFQGLHDSYNNFAYNENILAAYGSIAYKKVKYDLNIGLRGEWSAADLRDSFIDPVTAFLPYATFRYKLTAKQSIQLSYNSSLKRPNIYQLDPSATYSDPYTVYSGNPYLSPERRTSISLEHSIQFNGNYFASRIFYNRTTDAISNLTFINDTSAFETRVQNLGSVNQAGIQFSGSLKLGIFTFNPYFKIFDLYTSSNALAKQYSINNRNSLGIESALSAIASFKHEMALSLTFQYNSPVNDIQGNRFSDMLYFVSFEKTFKKGIKVGIVSALPFTISFTYQGSEIKGSDFYSHYEGNVQLTSIPVWFKLSYQFSSGKNRDKIDRSTEEIDNLPKKGF